MKILYCNLLKRSAFVGHKHFDAAWVNLLQKIAEVTLIWPDENWYTEVCLDVKNEICYIENELQKKPYLKWKIWDKGLIRHLALINHEEASIFIKTVLELDHINKFDYIIVSTIDLIAFAPFIKRFQNLQRIFLITHSAQLYENKMLWALFRHIKDHINYIAMEPKSIEYLNRTYGINKKRIHYIPHMLNPINRELGTNIELYDVVGISNSNDDREIRKIIELEEKEQFFKKNGIRAIFRSRDFEYNNGNLKVFKGRMGLTSDEYYTYVTKAKVMVLPFSAEFGLRSSGTIMDAFSQGIPIIGNPFMTMVQYNKQVPNICKLYTTMDELKNGVKNLLLREEGYEDEYLYFKKTHSDEFIFEQIKKTFI